MTLNDLLADIGRILWGMRLPGSERVVCQVVTLGDASSVKVFARILKGGWEEKEDEHRRLRDLLLMARRLSYKPGRGTWYNGFVWSTGPDRVEWEFNYDDIPQWQNIRSDPSYTQADFDAILVAERNEFPRDEEHVPGWLQDAYARAAEEARLKEERAEQRRKIEEHLMDAQSGPPVESATFDISEIRWWYTEELIEPYPPSRFQPEFAIPDNSEWARLRFNHERRALAMCHDKVIAVIDRPFHFRREHVRGGPEQQFATPGELVTYLIEVAKTVQLTPMADLLTEEQRVTLKIHCAVFGLQDDENEQLTSYHVYAGTYKLGDLSQVMESTRYRFRLDGLEPDQVWVIEEEGGVEFNLADARWDAIKDRQIGNRPGASRDLPWDAPERDVRCFTVRELGQPLLEGSVELKPRPVVGGDR